jgi:2-C-methyl-D-erythritol 4-phosphate cytidylyltransferase/2-C-methyl-D-erythritol 2,4-cyclodiphosphate synthase
MDGDGMRIGAIVVAAGAGKRMGGVPKALVKLGGTSLLSRALGMIASVPGAGPVVVACVPGRAGEFSEAAGAAGARAIFTDGGAERSDSVERAWRALEAPFDVVLIHDAARPFATAALALRVARAALAHGAAVPLVPVPDTVRRIEGGAVAGTLDRSALRLTQTPQGFRRELFAAALEKWVRDGRPAVTDDASMVERAGVAVNAVEGERGNVKITYPGDVEAAAANLRVGHGYDLHRTAPGRRMVLGGVAFDCGSGLLGHSDADVVMHAVCDAVLGAAGMGDIGRRFPDTDPAWRGADSAVLLATAAAEVAGAGFEVVNVDCTVIAEQPKIAPAAVAMAARIAACLNVEPARVSVKGKTNEGLGPEGRGEAIAAHAVALLFHPN